MASKSAAIAKISPPRLHGTVARQRLFGRLDEGLDHGAVWISGPPGAGKTSLATSYLEERGRRAFWYQVDQGDADPSTFFYFLGLAAPARKPALPLLQPEYLADLDGFAIRFFRSFFERLPEGSVWVLDNVHELPASSPLHSVIAHALDQLPQGIGAILVSRTAPAPDLARAQASGFLTAVEWPDLKLALDETALICQGRAVTDSALVRSLHEHSDGWAAGLMLMLERTRRGSFTAPDIETLTETFYRSLMRCLAGAGAQAEAVQVYRRCRDMLSIVLGLQPSAPTRALYESIRQAADDGGSGRAVP